MTASFVRIRQRARPLFALLFVLAMIVGEPAATVAQMRAEHSAAAGYGAVIAQGVAALPGPLLAWRVAGGEAVPAPDAKAGPYPPGFVVATRGGLMIDQPTTGDRISLQAGEAAFSPLDRDQRRIGAGPDPVPYLRVELTAADQAEDAGGDPVFYAGAPMPAPAGSEFDLELVRAALARDQQYVLPAGLGPALVLVYDGSVTVESENGRAIEMETGDIVEIDGEARIVGAGRNVGVVLAARIAAEAPSRPDNDAAGAASFVAATPQAPADPGAPLATPVAPNATGDPAADAPAMAALPPGIDTNVTYPIEPAATAPVAQPAASEIIPVTPEIAPVPSGGKKANGAPGSGDQRRQTRDQQNKDQRPKPKPEQQITATPKADQAKPRDETRVSTTPHAGGRGHAADQMERRPVNPARAGMEPGPDGYTTRAPNDTRPATAPGHARKADRRQARPERRGALNDSPPSLGATAEVTSELAPPTGAAAKTDPAAVSRPASRAKRTNGSVALTTTVCPAGALPAEFDRLCGQPLDDVTFTLHGPGFVDQAVLVGQRGQLRFTDLPRGDYRLAADLPGDFVTSYASCSAPGGSDVSERLNQNEFGFPVMGNNIACTWRVVPEDARGDLTQPTGGSLTIAVRACPPGATPANFEPGSCLPAGAAPPLRLVRGQRIVLEPTAASTDLATWQNLAPGEYVLLSGELPKPYRQVSLGGQGLAEGPHHFQITPDLRDTTLTLFLFAPANPDAPAALPAEGTLSPSAPPEPPAVIDAPAPAMPGAAAAAVPVSQTASTPPPAPGTVAAQPGTQAPASEPPAATAPEAALTGPGLPGHTLIVAAYACPPGMPLARVNPERCAPAGIAAPLTLTRRQGKIVPTSASPESGLTTWTGLPPGGYVLQIAALPAPFTNASIAGEPWSAGKNTVRLWVGPASKTTIVQLLLFADDAAAPSANANPEVAPPPAGSVAPDHTMAPKHATPKRRPRATGDTPTPHNQHPAARGRSASGRGAGIWDIVAKAHRDRAGGSRLETRPATRANQQQPVPNGCMIPNHDARGGNGNEVRAQHSDPRAR